MDFEDDKDVWDINDEYMFGDAFLVAPVSEFKARSRDVYLPAGATWYNFHTGAKHMGGKTISVDAPLDQLPLFVPAGTILPMGPEIQSTRDETGGELFVAVYTGADGEFSVYEDDGLTYSYADGAFARIPMRWDDAAGTLTIGAAEGGFDGFPAERTIHVRFIGEGDGFDFDATPDATVTYTGAATTVSAQ